MALKKQSFYLVTILWGQVIRQGSSIKFFCATLSEVINSAGGSFGGGTGIEHARRFHLHVWHLTVPSYGLSLSTWLCWASYQHSGLQELLSYTAVAFQEGNFARSEGRY